MRIKPKYDHKKIALDHELGNDAEENLDELN